MQGIRTTLRASGNVRRMKPGLGQLGTYPTPYTSTGTAAADKPTVQAVNMVPLLPLPLLLHLAAFLFKSQEPCER